MNPQSALAAINCAGTGRQCNVEATITGGFLEQGVQSTFSTVAGNTAQQRVNSVLLIGQNVCITQGQNTYPDQVEVGWWQNVGQSLPTIFRFYCIDGSYNTLSVGSVSGSHTYRVEYFSPLDRWDFTVDSGALWSTHVNAGSWTTNHPATNAERDSSADSFSVGPVFGSLQYRTATAWHQWSELGAKCFYDNDPALRNDILMQINSVRVIIGAASC